MKTWLLALSLTLPMVAAAQTSPATVAITFDDLPFASVPAEDGGHLRTMTARLLQHLQTHQVPAVGFVNEGKLYRDGILDAERVDLLHNWINAGFELGNHTHSHPSLNRVPLEAFQDDVLRGETVTRALMQDKGRPLRWFRHPFLHLGTTPEVRDAFGRFLAERGYTAAPVTVNNAEWVFAVAYARAQAQGNAESVRRIGEAYVPYMEAEFARSERLALDLFGRTIPHVVVLHANSLNADYFGALATMLRQRGYRFVSLDEALRDSAYALPLGFSGLEGESWLDRWARHAGLRPPQPPAVPGFVTQQAGATAYRGY